MRMVRLSIIESRFAACPSIEICSVLTLSNALTRRDAAKHCNLTPLSVCNGRQSGPHTQPRVTTCRRPRQTSVVNWPLIHLHQLRRGSCVTTSTLPRRRAAGQAADRCSQATRAGSWVHDHGLLEQFLHRLRGLGADGQPLLDGRRVQVGFLPQRVVPSELLRTQCTPGLNI